MLELSIASAPTAPWLLVAEIEHRMASVLDSAIQSIALTARQSPHDDVKEALGQLARRLQAHSAWNRALQAPGDPGMMDLLSYLKTVCAAATAADLDGRGARFQVIGPAVRLEATRCWLAGLIMAELFVNAVKHAAPDRRGLVTVEIGRSAGDVSCRVSDNGDRPDAADRRGRTDIVDAMVAQLGGEIRRQFEPAGGAVVLTFPELPAFGALSPMSASEPLRPFGLPQTEESRPGAPL